MARVWNSWKIGCVPDCQILKKNSLSMQRLQSTFWHSHVIRSAAMGNQRRQPVKLVLKWFHWSTPLVFCSDWSDHKTESESRSGPQDMNGCSMKSWSHKVSLFVSFEQLSKISRTRFSTTHASVSKWLWGCPDYFFLTDICPWTRSCKHFKNLRAANAVSWEKSDSPNMTLNTLTDFGVQKSPAHS